MNSHLTLDVLLQKALVHGVHLHTVPVVIVIHHVGAKLRGHLHVGAVRVGLSVAVRVVIATCGGREGKQVRLKRTNRKLCHNLITKPLMLRTSSFEMKTKCLHLTQRSPTPTKNNEAF